jgi:hypothetical protein
MEDLAAKCAEAVRSMEDNGKVPPAGDGTFRASVKVTMPWYAAALVYASRFALRLNCPRLSSALLRKAAASTPGLRMQIWKQL